MWYGDYASLVIAISFVLFHRLHRISIDDLRKLYKNGIVDDKLLGYANSLYKITILFLPMILFFYKYTFPFFGWSIVVFFIGCLLLNFDFQISKRDLLDRSLVYERFFLKYIKSKLNISFLQIHC